MADIISPKQRSLLMSSIKSKNTKPELIIRSALHNLGFRFRLHNKKLPGNPDLVLAKYHAAIFIHGCFWHKHEYCKVSHIPKTRTKFWTEKFDKNTKRDQKALYELKRKGWRTAWIWECSLSNKGNIRTTIEELAAWIKSDSEFIEIPDNEIIREISKH